MENIPFRSSCLWTVQLLFVILVSVAMCKENGTEPDDNALKFQVERLNGESRVYGGKEIAPPPQQLVVTEEIFFDLKIKDYYEDGKDYEGRIVIGCFGKLVPVTCLNFQSLAKGYRKGRLVMAYRQTKVQTIIRDFMIQMGDVKTKYASGDSIFGSTFQDESFALSHNHAGWVGMANFGPDTNGSQFYILLRAARWLDGKHVLFGKILQGMGVLNTIAEEETKKDNTPYRTVIIDKCGVVGIKQAYTLTADEFNTDEDILKTKTDEEK